jgi:tetratricopeptide (TPR) repeat protein
MKRELGDRVGIASSLNSLGEVARYYHEYKESRELFEESLAILEEMGEREGIATVLNNLGHLARNQGDYSKAHSLYERTLGFLRTLGDKHGVAVCFFGLAEVAYMQGEVEEAARLLDASEALIKATGGTFEPALLLEYDRTATAIRQSQGSRPSTHDWELKSEMALEQIINEVVRPMSESRHF